MAGSRSNTHIYKYIYKYIYIYIYIYIILYIYVIKLRQQHDGITARSK